MKGFAQTKCVDFGGLFALRSRPETLKLVLALAAQENLPDQSDVKTAFLHSKNKEEVLIEQPGGFENPAVEGTELLCKLNKTIIGLKETSKNWNDRLEYFPDGNCQQSKKNY